MNISRVVVALVAVLASAVAAMPSMSASAQGSHCYTNGCVAMTGVSDVWSGNASNYSSAWDYMSAFAIAATEAHSSPGNNVPHVFVTLFGVSCFNGATLAYTPSQPSDPCANGACGSTGGGGGGSSDDGNASVPDSEDYDVGTTAPCFSYNVCSGSDVVDSCSGGLVKQCSNQCVAGACVSPASPLIESFEVKPGLVRAGDTVQVHWSASNASSCAVSGDNGDAWDSESSGSGGMTSSPIQTRTVYSIRCAGLPGSNPSVAEDQATVIVVPSFHEN